MKKGKNSVKSFKNKSNNVEDGGFSKEKKDTSKSEERLAILKEIAGLERTGEFEKDVEKDPPSITLLSDDVDYLNKKISSKVKTRLANRIGERFLDTIIKNKMLIIKKIEGLENLNIIAGGAVITCNHFNPFDVFAIENVFRQSEHAQNKKLFKVIREGNYTNFPGLYGFFFRNCDTLPLSSNKETMTEFMKAVDTVLKRGDFVLMYPEQSMWWNYRKPKPFKQGAFRIAARNNVPILPIFITMEDSDIIGEDGFAIQEYTINIGRAIYPNENVTEKENSKIMMDKNFEYCKKVYEDFYKIPLEYTTEKKYLNKVGN